MTQIAERPGKLSNPLELIVADQPESEPKTHPRLIREIRDTHDFRIIRTLEAVAAIVDGRITDPDQAQLLHAQFRALLPYMTEQFEASLRRSGYTNRELADAFEEPQPNELLILR